MKSNIKKPTALILFFLVFGLLSSMIVYASEGTWKSATCTTNCVQGSFVSGITQCNATITNVDREGNWTNTTLWASSISTVNSTVHLVVRDSNLFSSNGSTGNDAESNRTLNVTFNSQQTLVDSNDYSFYITVNNATGNALLTCSASTILVDNSKPTIVTGGLTGNKLSDIQSINANISNATKYSFFLNSLRILNDKSITGDFVKLTTDSINIKLREGNNTYYFTATDGTNTTTSTVYGVSYTSDQGISIYGAIPISTEMAEEVIQQTQRQFDKKIILVVVVIIIIVSVIIILLSRKKK